MGCMTTTLQWYDCTYTVPESGKKQCVSLHFDHWVAEKCSLRRWDMRIQIDDLYLVAGHHAAQAWLPPDAACFHACFPDSCVHWDPDSCLHWDLRIANGIFGNKRLAETCKEAAEKCSCVAWKCAHVQPLLEFPRSLLAIYLTFFAPWQVAMGRWASNALTWVSGTCVRCAKNLGSHAAGTGRRSWVAFLLSRPVQSEQHGALVVVQLKSIKARHLPKKRALTNCASMCYLMATSAAELSQRGILRTPALKTMMGPIGTAFPLTAAVLNPQWKRWRPFLMVNDFESVSKCL